MAKKKSTKKKAQQPEISTPDLCDAYPDRVQVLEPILHNYGGRRSFGGLIATVKCHDDNSFVRKRLEEPGEGRVLVVDGGGSTHRALMGGDLAALAVENGWAGVVIWGCIRDIDEIRATDVGVQAYGVVPRKSRKRNIGELDVPLNFGGVNFHRDDWLYADNNGVIVADGALELPGQ